MFAKRTDADGRSPKSMGPTLAFLATAAIVIAGGAAQAATVTGMAQVTRPYTFTLGEYQVFLLGVDSVELTQPCSISGQAWDCWAAAQRQLETILGAGEITCESVVEADSPKRMIATCTQAGADVGLSFVKTGFGVALPTESHRYDAAQAEARAAKMGLWQGSFTTPAVWRKLPMRPRSVRPAFTGPPID